MERTPNKSQHRKSALEMNILPPLRRDSNLQPFDHESGALPTRCNYTFKLVCTGSEHQSSNHKSTAGSLFSTQHSQQVKAVDNKHISHYVHFTYNTDGNISKQALQDVVKTVIAQYLSPAVNILSLIVILWAPNPGTRTNRLDETW